MKKSSSTIHRAGSLLETLNSLQQQKSDVDLKISDDFRQGTIHIRGGVILSAHAGILHGNGALLTLAQMSSPSINVTPSTETVQKTIFISLSQIHRFIASQALQSEPYSQHEEETLLQDAKLLFFQFQYKKAVEKLVALLRKNRFFYPAWLWQSRILTRKDYIEKALDEAYRWGNHDQDVWREARKIRPQIDNDGDPAKRCFFCWSILQQDSFCDHCRAFLTITGQPISTDLKIEEIKIAVAHFQKALSSDPNNSRVSYSLAVAYFNLKNHSSALKYMRQATRISPQSGLYRKSLSLLLAVAKVHSSPKPKAQTAATQLPPKANHATILLIEDSQTSRKVLSMLFKRNNYKILEAASGRDALRLAQSNCPQLVILDVMLPDTNGHDLLPQLRKLEHLQKTPVIMLTGKHDSTDRMKGIRAGASEYVTKPFNPQKLISIVQHYLEHNSVTSSKPNVDTASIQTVPACTTPSPLKSTSRPTHPSAAAAKVDVEKGTATASQISAKNGAKSIFVIEDSVTSRKVLSMVLGRNGFTVHEATTGKEALTIAETIRPDLVLLDVMLPDTTGYSVLPQLKQLPHFKDLPVIMLTGKNGSSDRMKGMLAGTNEYLTKPFNPQKLLSVIGGYL